MERLPERYSTEALEGLARAIIERTGFHQSWIPSVMGVFEGYPLPSPEPAPASDPLDCPRCGGSGHVDDVLPSWGNASADLEQAACDWASGRGWPLSSGRAGLMTDAFRAGAAWQLDHLPPATFDPAAAYSSIMAMLDQINKATVSGVVGLQERLDLFEPMLRDLSGRDKTKPEVDRLVPRYHAEDGEFGEGVTARAGRPGRAYDDAKPDPLDVLKMEDLGDAVTRDRFMSEASRMVADAFDRGFRFAVQFSDLYRRSTRE